MLINLCRTELNLLRFNFIRFYSVSRKNHYEVLGVKKTATTQEIKQAFYSLSKKNHPDIVGAESKLFLDIKDAYETLKDDTKRQVYDSKIEYDFSAPNFNETLRERHRSYEYKTGDPMADNPRNENYESIELSSQYGHFYDPNTQFEIMRKNKKSIIIGTFIFIVVMAANIWYIYYLKSKRMRPALMNLWRTGQYLRRFNFTVTRCFTTNRRNYYDVLGISKTATSKEIKDAFYSLSKKYHPDVVGANSDRFLEIKEAYDTLKDDNKRQMYDSGFNSHGFDHFPNQRPQSDFSRGAYRNVRRDYEFRTNSHYTPDEIDRIWKQFQEQLKNRMNAEYDEKTRKQAQDQRYSDYVKNREYRWQKHAEEHDKKNAHIDPFANSHAHAPNQRGRNLLAKLLSLYFFIFFGVSLFRILFGPMNDTEAKVVVMEYNPRDGTRSYSYSDSKDRLRRMMETPPMDTKEDSRIDPNYPYGLPQFGRKE